MKTLKVILAWALLFLGGLTVTSAQGRAFTYQGRLDNNGAVAHRQPWRRLITLCNPRQRQRREEQASEEEPKGTLPIQLPQEEFRVLGC